MTEKALAAKEALRRSKLALKKGEKDLARQWAEKAAILAPNLEEAWLLLAATSRPQLSIRYLERALVINPQSKNARKGMAWAKKRLLRSKQPAKTPEVTQKTKATKEDVPVGGILQTHTPLLHDAQPRKKTRSLEKTQPIRALVPAKRTFWRQSLPTLILTILVVSAVWALLPRMTSFAASLANVNATPTATFSQEHWGESDISKPTYTPSPTPTFTPTLTPTITSTPDPTATARPTEKPIVEEAPPVQEEVYTPAGAKYVLVDISEQHLYAYEGNTLVFSFVASTGMNNATATGNFSVLNKIPNAYGATWDIWMPNWLGIYWAGTLQNGIHALPIMSNGATLWAGYLGTPISYGCVVLGSYEAQLLYNWVDVGTPVDIQW